MERHTEYRLAYGLCGVLVLAVLVGCGDGAARDTDASTTAQGAAREQPATGDQAKIAQAMSAGPEEIAHNATIMDWPATEGGEPRVLRQGTNRWVCFPDMPDTEGADPMCLDEPWQKWADAWVNKTAPQIQQVGIAYMLAGGSAGSNTDPFATGPTPENEWGMDPAHVMIVVPNVSDLQGLPTQRDNGGPWVMFRGTPYAHIMVPVPADQQN